MYDALSLGEWSTLKFFFFQVEMLQSIYKLCLDKTMYSEQQQNLAGILCGWDFF